MTHTDKILLMNGIDHQEAQPQIAEILSLANERLDNIEIEQTTLKNHLEDVRNFIADEKSVSSGIRGGIQMGTLFGNPTGRSLYSTAPETA